MNIMLTEETLDWLGDTFNENKVLDKYGISFETFVNEWKLGRIEKYI